MTAAGSKAARWKAAALKADTSERGQGLVEYGLILALVALFTVIGLVFFPGTIAAILDFIGRVTSTG
jgi:Flp pilus assembly pilin Flp